MVEVPGGQGGRRRDGGLQATNFVAGYISSVLRETHILLNGKTQAAQLARHELRWAQGLPTGKVQKANGTVARAVKLLAGYGFYIAPSTDRMVSRIV